MSNFWLDLKEKNIQVKGVSGTFGPDHLYDTITVELTDGTIYNCNVKDGTYCDGKTLFVIAANGVQDKRRYELVEKVALCYFLGTGQLDKIDWVDWFDYYNKIDTQGAFKLK